MSQIRDTVEQHRQRWLALSRWQRLIALWFILLALVLPLVALIFSQSNSARRAEAALAALAQQEAQFKRDANEAKALLVTPANAKALAIADVPALQAIAGEGVSVTAVPGGGFRLMSASTPYAQWWALCDELDRRFGLTMRALELAPKQDVKENVSFDMTVATGRAP